jgi:Na+/H+ antiporter NhaA
MDPTSATVPLSALSTTGSPAPLRRFVATENLGALALVAATVVALVWANSPWSASYEALWTTELGVRLGVGELAYSLREWVNEGLMAVFFFVAGLEIRREFDMGELRERRRLTAPVLAALGGMLVPAGLYLAITAGTDWTGGWGVVVGTDTAFALGVLALTRGTSPRARTFLLTLVVIDDAIALTVIAVAYTDTLSLPWLGAALAVFGLILALRRADARSLAYALLAAGMWFAVAASGLHATIAGVAVGLVASAYPPGRDGLHRAGSLWRRFRMTPTPQLAQQASRSITATISPNEMLQQRVHPWSSYLVVPLFALANAGLPLDGAALARAATSRITLGIVVGLVIGKALGIVAVTWLTTRRALGALPLLVTWPSLVGVGALAGIGFTVSLLIADISFAGDELEEAKIGILAASALAASLGWAVFRVIGALPSRLRAAGADRLAPAIVDLTEPVEPDVDHVLGALDAKVTLVWYGDFQCAHCRAAGEAVRELQARLGSGLAVVYRHLPLNDIHPHAQAAAEAAEAAAAQGQFWPMWAALYESQHDLRDERLIALADAIGLDVSRFAADLRTRRHALRIARDISSADDSGAAGTPTIFLNGRRYTGHIRADALVRAAHDVALVPTGRSEA